MLSRHLTVLRSACRVSHDLRVPSTQAVRKSAWSVCYSRRPLHISRSDAASTAALDMGVAPAVEKDHEILKELLGDTILKFKGYWLSESHMFTNYSSAAKNFSEPLFSSASISLLIHLFSYIPVKVAFGNISVYHSTLVGWLVSLPAFFITFKAKIAWDWEVKAIWV